MRARHLLLNSSRALLRPPALRAPQLARRGLCAVHTELTEGAAELRRSQPFYDDRDLWVSYTDAATQRRRLVLVAQQVRELLPESQAPDIILPLREMALRKGFWHMRFESSEHAEHAVRSLNGKPFVSACRSIQGELHMERGRARGTDVWASVNQPAQDPDPVHAWIHASFSPYGTITSLRLPRLVCNWDQGFGFVRFERAEEAEEALEALDGVAGPIPGCRLFVDYSRGCPHGSGKPLVVVRPPPVIPVKRIGGRSWDPERVV